MAPDFYYLWYVQADYNYHMLTSVIFRIMVEMLFEVNHGQKLLSAVNVPQHVAPPSTNLECF